MKNLVLSALFACIALMVLPASASTAVLNIAIDHQFQDYQFNDNAPLQAAAVTPQSNWRQVDVVSLDLPTAAFDTRMRGLSHPAAVVIESAKVRSFCHGPLGAAQASNANADRPAAPEVAATSCTGTG